MILGLFALAASAGSADATAGACQLRSNYDFLRDLTFTRAATQVPAHSADLSRLKRAVRAEGLEVRSVSYDPASGRLECQMILKLTLPAAARPFFGNVESIGGPVRFWAEPQEDKSGYSIITEGLGPIMATVIGAAARFALAPDFGTAAAPPTLAPVSPAAAPARSEKAKERPLPTAGFDCALASTAIEHLICESDALAEADRTMSQRYFAIRKSVRGAARQRLLASQRTFLSRRNTCGDEACLAGLYMARAAELAR